MKEKKKSGERGMSNCCARYHEVDLLLTLYVETGRRRHSQWVALLKDLRLSVGIAMADGRDECRARVCWRTLASRGLDWIECKQQHGGRVEGYGRW